MSLLDGEYEEQPYYSNAMNERIRKRNAEIAKEANQPALKHTYAIRYEVNGGEYYSHVRIQAATLTQRDEYTVVADGTVIELDERIVWVKRVEEDKGVLWDYE